MMMNTFMTLIRDKWKKKVSKNRKSLIKKSKNFLKNYASFANSQSVLIIVKDFVKELSIMNAARR